MATTWMPSLRHDWGPPADSYAFDLILDVAYCAPVDGPVPEDTYADDYVPRDEDDPRAPRVPLTGRVTTARYAGRCAVCHAAFVVGDDVVIRDDHPRVAHRTCGVAEPAPRASSGPDHVPPPEAGR